MMRMPPVSIFIAANLGLETFVMLSAFLGGYRAFQIMDSKDGVLSIVDILKIWARKWLRMAPMYYFVWMFSWALTSRIASGPLWTNTNMAYETCPDNWVYTLLWVGNIFPNLMPPYTGCF